ncbi:MAG: ATP-binding protein [Coriobacteriales bacterium]|nr:ATP-binding protein [Coriobacteriales bacterium]
MDTNLSQFVASHAGNDIFKVEETLGNGYVRLNITEAQRRQAAQDITCVEDIIIELVRNSRDAGAHYIFIATTRDANTRILTVLDDGCGIPPSLHKRVFEPRVTSKLNTPVQDSWGFHGRGMALYSIKENAANAQIVASDLGLGTSVTVTVDCHKTPERTDQSSWPVYKQTNEDGIVLGSGPHNIIRTCLELVLQSKEPLNLYLGSPLDIVATLVSLYNKGLSTHDYLLTDPLDLPYCKRLSFATDAAALSDAAQQVGLTISKRSAHRVLTGEIQPLKTIIQMLRQSTLTSSTAIPEHDRRSFKMTEAEKREFGHKCMELFEPYGANSYVKAVGEPQISIRGSRVIVSFDTSHDD